MKKIIVLFITAFMLVSLCACGEKKILKCDGCGKDVEVDASSDMTDEWTVFCSDCEKELDIDLGE